MAVKDNKRRETKEQERTGEEVGGTIKTVHLGCVCCIVLVRWCKLYGLFIVLICVSINPLIKILLLWLGEVNVYRVAFSSIVLKYNFQVLPLNLSISISCHFLSPLHYIFEILPFLLLFIYLKRSFLVLVICYVADWMLHQHIFNLIYFIGNLTIQHHGPHP